MVLLTIREAAAVLRVHPKTLCGQLRARKIELPLVPFGGKKLIDEADLRAFIESRKVNR